MAGVAPGCYGVSMRVLALAAVLTVVHAGGIVAADHDEMRAALREVENARRHLEAAKHEYRGHRPTAVEELRQAEDQIRRGIEKAGGKAEQ